MLRLAMIRRQAICPDQRGPLCRRAGGSYCLEPGGGLSFDAAAPRGPEEIIEFPLSYLSVIICPRERRHRRLPPRVNLQAGQNPPFQLFNLKGRIPARRPPRSADPKVASFPDRRQFASFLGNWPSEGQAIHPSRSH